MATGGNANSGSLPEMVSNIFWVFLAFKIVSLVFAMITRKDVLMSLGTIPVAYTVLRFCISTQVNMTQTLTLAVGMTVLHGLWNMTESVKNLGSVLLAPPEPEQSGPQMNRAQRRAAAKKKGK
eukprot:TRINITY_DN5313_c0_g1_i1.p1 TRINITY_DN5313_c0_g1~~TRINITY_DN5313_c0_g1_i1.p1  ORF type:complete len:140 (+),score=19.56 TRINITY_DN5313_c0_g1_i1:52-420(+)